MSLQAVTHVPMKSSELSVLWSKRERSKTAPSILMALSVAGLRWDEGETEGVQRERERESQYSDY